MGKGDYLKYKIEDINNTKKKNLKNLILQANQLPLLSEMIIRFND